MTDSTPFETGYTPAVITLTLTDIGEGKVQLGMSATNADGSALTGDENLTPAMLHAMGANLLFRSGDMPEAGLIAAEAAHRGVDAGELAERINMARDEKLLDELRATVAVQLEAEKAAKEAAEGGAEAA
jgi:hypothetical protein